MKRHIALFAAVVLGTCVFVPGAVSAAWPQEQEALAQKMQNLSQVLNLSPTQKSQLEPIIKAEMPKLAAIKNNPSLSGRQKRKQMRAIHSETDPQLKAILNPTQYTQWESIRKAEINEIKEEKK